jgi:hypothetical protein
MDEQELLKNELYKAIVENNISKVQKILNQDIDPNLRFTFTSHTPLHMAASNGYTDIMKLLITKGANINIENIYFGTPLNLAAKNGETAAVKLLLKKRAQLNPISYKRTPLIEAAETLVNLVQTRRRVNPLYNFKQKRALEDIIKLLVDAYLEKNVAFSNRELEEPVIRKIINSKRAERAKEAALATYHSMRQKGIPKDIARYIIMKKVVDSRTNEAWDIPKRMTKSAGVKQRTTKSLRNKGEAPRKKERTITFNDDKNDDKSELNNDNNKYGGGSGGGNYNKYQCTCVLCMKHKY